MFFLSFLLNIFFKCYVYKTQVAFRGQLYDTVRKKEKKSVSPHSPNPPIPASTHILKDTYTPFLTPSLSLSGYNNPL